MNKSLRFIQIIVPLIMVGCVPTSTEVAPVPTQLIVPQPSVSNEKYVPNGHFRQGLDVYLPIEGEAPHPTILALHGGGFRARSKSLYGPMAGYFTDKGYAMVATNYRLTPEFKYPAQIEDAFCALGWVLANSEKYGFDSERVYVMGDSAGGYLAAMLGTVEDVGIYKGNCPYNLPDPTSIKGVVVFYGFYDLTSLDGHNEEDIRGGLQPFMGASHDKIPAEKLIEMSPKSWIDGSEPPFLIIHGSEDKSVQSWLAEEFAKSLDEAGVQVELMLLEAGHAFILQPISSPTMTQALDAIIPFLTE